MPRKLPKKLPKKLICMLLNCPPVHQFQDVLVEVVNKVVEELLVSLRRESLPADPLHVVPDE